MSTLRASTQDEVAIKANMAAFADAWNIHSAKTLAALFAEDADFVNVMGLWLKGRAEIEQGHAQVFATFLSESHLNITDTQIKFFKADVALLHSSWEIVGQKSPDGEHQLHKNGILTALTTYKNNTWQIVALHNTGTIPLPNYKQYQNRGVKL